MGYGVSSFIIKWVNFLTLGVSFCVLGLGIWLSTKHGDCDKFLTVPVLIIGAFVFIISLLGFVGAWKDLVWVLCVYLVIMFFLLAGLALFTAFAFVVTNEGAGRAITGQGFKEYNLGDYSGYIRRLFNNPTNWKHLQDCLLNPDYCAEIARNYDSTTEFANAQLNSIQSGCCRPPAECKFPMINVTYYNLTTRYIPKPVAILTDHTVTSSNPTGNSSTTISTSPSNPGPPPPPLLVTVQIAAITNLTGPTIPQSSIPQSFSAVKNSNGSSNFDTTVLSTTVAYQSPYRTYDDSDCITFENDPNTMCFACNSCKAGVAQFIKKDWRSTALINIAVFVLLVTLYIVGCCARRSASRAQYTKKLKQRELGSENISQSIPNRSPFGSSGRLSAASHDEELALDPQVRCWQTEAPGEPEDLVPIQSICPMRAPWRTTPPADLSRKRPGTTKRHGKKKMPRLDGQTMVPGKRTRTEEKEQLEHPLVPFGAARRIVTVLNYEESKSRVEKLQEQLPPVSPFNTLTSVFHPALQSFSTPTSDGNTPKGDRTPTREIQVESELSTETHIEQGHKAKDKDEAAPVDPVQKMIPAETSSVQELQEEKPTRASASGGWGPFGHCWRPKSPDVVHQNILFNKDPKKRHINSLFEVDKSTDISNKTQRQAALKPNTGRGWRTPTHVHNVGERTQLEEPAEPEETEDGERSYKVEMPPYTDVIVELFDDVSEGSESVQDHLKELGGIRIHVRDSGRKIVSWGYDKSEDSEQAQGELKEVEGLDIHVRDSESKKNSWGDLSEESVPKDFKEPAELRIHVRESQRRIASVGGRVSDKSVQAELKEPGGLSIFVRGPERKIVSWGDVSEEIVQEDLKEPERLRVVLRGSERKLVARDNVVSEENVYSRLKDPTGIRVCVRESERKIVSWADDVFEGSEQRELKGPMGPGVHVEDSERKLVLMSDNVSQESVNKGLKEPVGRNHVIGTERKKVSWVDKSEASVQRELNELMEPFRHVRDTEKKMVSRPDNVSEERVQEDFNELSQSLTHVRDTERRNVSWGDYVPEESVQGELKESGVIRNSRSDESVQEDSIDSGELQVRLRDSEIKIITRELVSEESVQEQGGLRVNVGDLERIVSVGNVVTEVLKSAQAEVTESGGLRVHVTDSERIIVPSGDPEMYAHSDSKEKQITRLDVPTKPRGKKRSLQTVEIDEEQILSLKKEEEARKTTASVNYDFEVPKLIRAIHSNLGPVKQNKLKSADTESRERGISQYVFDPPKISRPTLEGDEEPLPKPEEENRPITVLEESGPRLQVEEEPRSKLQEKSRAKGIRTKSTEQNRNKHEEKSRKNSRKLLRSMSPEETQAKVEDKPRTNSLREPRPKSVGEPRPTIVREPRSVEESPMSSFKGPPRKPVGDTRPKLRDKSPRESSTKEPERKSVEESRSTVEEKSPRVSSAEDPRPKSAEEPPPKYGERAPRTSSSREPQRQLVEEKPPHASSFKEPRRKSVEDHRPKFEDKPRTSSFKEPRPDIEGEHRHKVVEKPPRTKHVAEPRPKSIYEFYPETLHENRPKSIYEHRPSPAQEPRPTIVRESQPRPGEESRLKLVRDSRPTLEEKRGTSSIKESQPRHTLVREPWPTSGEENRPQSGEPQEPRPKSVEEPRPTFVRERRHKSVEEPRPTILREQRLKSSEDPRSTLVREHQTKSTEEHRRNSGDGEPHDLDSTERGESSTRRQSRKRKEKPQNP